ncbi:uncharacterized protein LOC113232473 [Hyposmocoma kahamanoa]|uniref:uncharacterized protein LOC113232473 n=1 Tax=Hyposmocoma kahamanoa TaxID=1477025 RepID=UPI000E6D9E9B|nr:uncharacterized protein LOC113232473 [Hyposmocoma kahamanoa]
MYAIAGTGHYYTTETIHHDNCANKLKKKVVLTCVPKHYNFSYDKIEKWAYIDIAAVKVESPYDFTLTEPIPECRDSPEQKTWVPNKIKINFEVKYQNPGNDALILGWGHTSKWRAADDPHDYNSKFLQYGSTLIQNKTNCKNYYRNLPHLQATIDKYMICTLMAGNIDDDGELIFTQKPDADGCSDEDKMTGTCKLERSDEEFRKTQPPLPISISPVHGFGDVTVNLRRSIQNNTHTRRITRTIKRRSGICQNDHGGPLITWVGSHEVLIGVASVFRISNKSECIGPYLYTSTQCNGQFLQCVIFENEPKDVKDGDEILRLKQKDICDVTPAESGFEIIKRRISWKHHPDGPAENELEEEIFERPQIPLYNFNKHFKSTRTSSMTNQSGNGIGDNVQRTAKAGTSVKLKP